MNPLACMANSGRRPVLWAVLALLAWSAPAVPGQPPAHPAPIIVTLDDNYPPYVFRDANGKLMGILPDQWALWSKKTGVPVDLRAMEWSKAQEFMRSGLADVIDTIFLTPERAQYYAFTPSYARIQVPIFAHKTLGGIADIDSLKGFTIGVKSGDAVIDHLAHRGIDTIKEYPSYEAIILAAKNQELKVFSVDQPAAVYYMYKHRIAGDFRQAFVLYTGEFHRAVPKNRLDLLNLVQSGFGQISRSEYRAINQKWMGSPFLFREILHEWGSYILLGLVIILGLAALNAILSVRVRSKTAELQTSREYFATVFDSINDALFIHDSRNFQVLDVNRRMLEMYGYDSRAQAIAAFNQMKGGEAPFSVADAFVWLEKARDQGPQVFEWLSVHQDGHPFWVEISIRRVRIGPDDRLIVACRDISDRKKAEEERLRYERQIQESQKLESLGLLAGGIAHDFNNLLAAIMGNLDLALLTLPPGAPARDDILSAGISTKRAAELVQQMLTYSGQGRFVVEALDVAALLQRSMQLIRSSVPPAVDIQIKIPPAIPNIDADESQVRQVVMNLVANAVEALENRPGLITLAAGVLDSHRLPAAPIWPHTPLPDGSYVYIEVTDSGPGIPTERLGKIFEPFYTTKFTGRGLGLPAVLGIVRGHKGAIQVATTLGKGSTFRILFPAKPTA